MIGLLASLAVFNAHLAPSTKPERPIKNWVFRSVLDRKARIVTLALSEDLWVAYDATNCGLYKAWKGGVKFDGAVYTASHGPQPTTEGSAFLQGNNEQKVWALEIEGKTSHVKPVFRGYRLENGQCVLQYEISRPSGSPIRIEETPEAQTRDVSIALSRNIRVFGLRANETLRLNTVVQSVTNQRAIKTSGDFEIVATDTIERNGAKWLEVTGSLVFRSAKAGPASNSLEVTFATPGQLSQAAEEQLWTGPASLPAEPQAPREPGVAVRVYDIREEMQALPTLIASQTPNRSFVSPVINLKNQDFGDFPNGKFLTIITGFITAPAPGKYQFRLGSDDGSNLYIRDTVVVRHDGLHSMSYAAGEFTLEREETPFRIEHFDNGGDAELRLEWLKPGTQEWELVPASAFTTPAGEVRVTSPGKKNVTLAGAFGRPGDQRPLESVHPSYDLITLRPDGFKPRVGGIDFLPDGRMVLCTWDAEGAVYVLDGVLNDAKSIKVKQIASGLAEPLGIKVVGKDIYVLQKQELTKLVDRDGDGITDEYYALANGWGVTDNFHEFAFGLVYDNGYFYANLAIAINPGGSSTQPQNPDRGKVIKIDAKTGKYEWVAQGLRTPNGIGFGVDKQIFLTDNQGDWLPSSKLLHYSPGAFYGSRAVDPNGTKSLKETPPVVWLPQGEIGNSPSNPTTMKDGPYRGQMLHGDVTHGGVKRVFVEKVNGVYQGAVYRFTQGLEAGVNRITWGPDGALYVGGIGAAGNWGQEGKERFGLQKLSFNGKPAFEILATRAKTNGFEIELTQPLAENITLDPSFITVSRWRYVPTAEYGGPKIDERLVSPRVLKLSRSRKVISIGLEEMKPGHVYYVRLDPTLISASGQSLWSTESWYTLNEVPVGKTISGSAITQTQNVLSDAEKKDGFSLLFDGKSTNGWIGFRQKSVPKGWQAIDGELRFVPGLGGGDLRTLTTYTDFDLRFEWKVAPGGNSGCMYRSTEEFGASYLTGPEYQLLDNQRHADGRSPLTSAGSNYALYATDRNQARPAGMWNSSRIVAKGNHIEHYLNGKLVVKYEINSPEWKANFQKSKFASFKDYAQRKEGFFAFQDHGDPVAFRNMRVKRL